MSTMEKSSPDHFSLLDNLDMNEGSAHASFGTLGALAKFPREIRDMIYGLCIGFNMYCLLCLKPLGSGEPVGSDPKKEETLAALLLVSKSFSREITEFHHKEGHFLFGIAFYPSHYFSDDKPTYLQRGFMNISQLHNVTVELTVISPAYDVCPYESREFLQDIVEGCTLSNGIQKGTFSLLIELSLHPITADYVLPPRVIRDLCNLKAFKRIEVGLRTSYWDKRRVHDDPTKSRPENFEIFEQRLRNELERSYGACMVIYSANDPHDRSLIFKGKEKIPQLQASPLDNGSNSSLSSQSSAEVNSGFGITS